MSHLSLIKPSIRRLITMIVPLAALTLGGVQLTYADSPLSNAAVYEIGTATSQVQQISLHAPGSTTPAFVVAQGQYVTPNGHYAMAMPAVGAYNVTDLQTGTQVAGWSFSVQKSLPVSMAVSPNGTYAAVASLSTVDSLTWTVVLFNLHDHTQYEFSRTPNLSTPDPTILLQLTPQIEGWTGDESALILSTRVPASGAPTRLYFKMVMSGITFTAADDLKSVPSVTPLGADQQISRLVFSPDSNHAAFGFADPGNMPVNFVPLTSGPGASLPSNTIKVIDLTSGATQTLAQAAAGQGLTAPAWAPDGSKLYFGAGPYQNTPFVVNVHLLNYDFSSHAIAVGDSLVIADPAHIGVSDMQVCVDQVFIRQVGISADHTSLTGTIVSAPLSSVGTQTPVYTAQANALGPCTPTPAGGSGGGVIPSIPTVVSSGATATSASIACVLTPQLTIGGQGMVAPGAANNLRAAPNVGSAMLGQIPAGDTFSVLAGPFCDNTSGYLYWQVTYHGVTGYTAEGKTSYLVTPYVFIAVTGTPSPTPITIVIVPPATTTPVASLIPGTCISGYVWREASPTDHVCVTPPTRSQAAADNAAAASRIVPIGTCINGYVWREANGTDHVCVTPATRSEAAADNAAAASRVDPAGAYGPNTCISGYVWREAYTGDVVCVLPAIRSQAAVDNAAAASRVVPVGTCINGYVWREAFPGDLVCVTPDVRTQAAADNAAAASRIAH